MADASGLRRAMERRTLEVAHRTKDQLVANLRDAAPVGETRRLRDGITGTVQAAGRGRAVIAVETADLVQAHTTDKGARPHVIVPRNRRALRWVSGATVHFARRVNHPGNRGSRWWRNQLTGPAFRAAIRAALGR